jgi:hypothetical protein
MKWGSGRRRHDLDRCGFAKFSQMLLDGGSLDGRQYLSPRAFDEMVADHIGPRSGLARDYFCFPGDGFGYGLGLAERTDPGNATPGRIEMGRRQRLLFYHRPKAGHVLHPAADAVVTQRIA